MADKKDPYPDRARRRLLGGLVAGGGAALAGAGPALSQDQELRFPGEEPRHRLVYQFNKIEPEYQAQVLFSAGAVLRKYGDDVKLALVCFGPGIHILARAPLRPVSEEIRQRVASLAEYGVEFHACNNTLKGLKWTEKELVPFARVVDSGAGDLMELQEQGYSYISW